MDEQKTLKSPTCRTLISSAYVILALMLCGCVSTSSPTLDFSIYPSEDGKPHTGTIAIAASRFAPVIELYAPAKGIIEGSFRGAEVTFERMTLSGVNLYMNVGGDPFGYLSLIKLGLIVLAPVGAIGGAVVGA